MYPFFYISFPQSPEETPGDKRKKYPSYDINVHNPSLLNKMIDNPSYL
jgi:hypothetical protein